MIISAHIVLGIFSLIITLFRLKTDSRTNVITQRILVAVTTASGIAIPLLNGSSLVRACTSLGVYVAIISSVELYLRHKRSATI